jgi:Tol biopolymer transport system component
MIRLIINIAFFYGLCLALLSGWHLIYHQADTENIAWIIFTSRSGQTNNIVLIEETIQLYRMRSDGSQQQKLYETKASDINILKVSPDGQWIFFSLRIFVSPNLLYENYRIRVDGSQLQYLGSGYTRDLFTTDDKPWLIFNEFRNDRVNIYRRRIDGSQEENLTPLERYSSLITISAQWIYFITGDEPYNIYRMHLDGTHVQYLMPAPSAEFTPIIITPNKKWLFTYAKGYIYRLSMSDLPSLTLIKIPYPMFMPRFLLITTGSIA